MKLRCNWIVQVCKIFQKLEIFIAMPAEEIQEGVGKKPKMAESTNSKLSRLQEEGTVVELPDCFPCKVIGAGACFGSSAYLMMKRNTFGQTRAARSSIGIVAAGMFVNFNSSRISINSCHGGAKCMSEQNSKPFKQNSELIVVATFTCT